MIFFNNEILDMMLIKFENCKDYNCDYFLSILYMLVNVKLKYEKL